MADLCRYIWLGQNGPTDRMRGKMIYYRWLSIKCFIALILFSSASCCQTKYYEDMVMSHYFDIYIKKINTHLGPTLTQKEKLILSKVRVVVDTTASDYLANSNSDNHEINLGSKLIRSLVKYSVASLIENNLPEFNRQRFSGYYLSIYPYVSPETYPEDAAELTDVQRKELKRLGDAESFGWNITEKIMFIYLHELGHQVQGYTAKVAKIDQLKKTQIYKDSLYLDLEFDADCFATDKLARMDLNPVEYEDALTLFFFAKERRFQTVRDFLQRKIVYFRFCYTSFKCDRADDALCNKIENRLKDWSTLNYYYGNLYDPKNLKDLSSKAISENDVNSLYNLGDFYLKGSSNQEVNIDTALQYYLHITSLKFSDTSRYGATTHKQFLQIVEYADVVAGKIYEHHKKNVVEALKYYMKAREICLFLSKGYYDALVQRLGKN